MFEFLTFCWFGRIENNMRFRKELQWWKIFENTYSNKYAMDYLVPNNFTFVRLISFPIFFNYHHINNLVSSGWLFGKVLKVVFERK